MLSIGPVPAAAVDAKEESAALSASGNGTSAAPSYVISATEDEIYLMAACVAMETGDDRYEDQLAVASCIVNRVKSKKVGQNDLRRDLRRRPVPLAQPPAFWTNTWQKVRLSPA